MADNDETTAGEPIKDKKVPLLALRDLVIFPNMVIPLFVGREKSIKALESAMEKDRIILLVAQKDARTDDPGKDDIYETGTLSEILQILKLPDGAIRVLVEGLSRVRIKKYTMDEPFFEVEIEELPENNTVNKEIEALMRLTLEEFQKHVKMNKKIPPETIMSVADIESPGRLADVMSAHIALKHEEKQDVLNTLDPAERLHKLSVILKRENEILEIEKKIQGKVKSQLEKSQREYYLSEQLKAIQKELGKGDSSYNETEELKEKIAKAGMAKDAEEKALKELDRLEKMMPMSAEATVIRTYLDWLIGIPWKTKTKEKLDIKEVQKILDEDHYGLEKPKERIVEYLAVKKNVKGTVHEPIICFVGPPGVGKTSLARSIARAQGRNFVRVSLGGVRDEAEIRGHRRTYIGAMPGRIIQSIRKAKSKNPVFLLDEIDKMSSDFRGDPAAAMLEVLDPEQNNTFMDHYLDTEFDLSDVMFITTANTLYGIPLPLQDRMEVIEINSYTALEKTKIAQKYLVPKQMKQHGLTDKDADFTEESLNFIVLNHTREAGVRNLEREIKTVCRKIAKEKVSDPKKFKKITVAQDNLQKYLGAPKFLDVPTKNVNGTGISTGLAWTEFGGDVLVIEVSVVKGKGGLMLTGKLGDVMKESAQAALSFTRSRAGHLGIKEEVFGKSDIHIHVPEGAIPKDGPSAGITMATALISAFTGRPVKQDLAMTGEITLRGRVLPIGGLKEKTLAALRNGVKEVVVPDYNRKDYDELPAYVKEGLKFHFVKTMDEVIKLALESKSAGIAIKKKKTGKKR
ncbi:MAG TPA: endopeptidase La [Candidatus Goldiibacteriota bacterium]|nr:endopeptidase La [Candidatus Goldiibacteriota bacterium]